MKNALFYILGAVSGAAATYFIMKKRTEQQIQDEVDAFKDEYKERMTIREYIPEAVKPHAPTDEEKDILDKERAKRLVELNLQKKQDLMQVRDISERMNYNAFSKPPKEEDIDIGDDDSEIVEGDDHPREGLADMSYVISPDQFINECPFYDKTTLEYFEDGILANALTEEPIEDIDAAVGFKSLEHFGEYEDDVVYVRNERYSTDYEIILQHRPFVTLPEDAYPEE